MADAAVSALVNDLLGRLTSEAYKEFRLLWGFNNDILSLKEDFTSIQAVLEDAEIKRIENKEVNLWFKSLRSASFEVENVLDEISTQNLLRRLHKQTRGTIYEVKAFFPSSTYNKVQFRVKTAHKVKSLRAKLDAIKIKRSELGLTPDFISRLDVGVGADMPNRESSSLIYKSLTILGRNKEMEMVTKKICNKDIGKSENGVIRVFGIWGMGGIGKTTLAQLVYNHERVKEYFEFKCWVYVSENFQVKEIIIKILHSIDKDDKFDQSTPLDTLQQTLQTKLREKKFLIVLDDVWIEYDEKTKCDQLSDTLGCGIEGSIVVMTTRSQTTSQMFAKLPELQHKLGCLSLEESWLLFKNLAFAEGRVGDGIRELEFIGREIVEKCEGLPLAVKTLGSLMWSKSSSREWEHVKGSMVWNLQKTKVLPALKLSYDNLFPHLKRCFGYCCLFPKGYKMKKDLVIQLWVVNGFIPPREDISLYVLGEEVFNCLVWRSFFQVVKYEYTNDRYKMHDLMHDMARNEMGDDFFVTESLCTEVKIPNYEVLHLGSSCPNLFFSPEDIGNLTSLRSILMLEGINDSRLISQIFDHMYLRVLYIHGFVLRTLPESICKLKHLRYLKLTDSDIKVLPESIIYLQNLQVLVLYRCRNLIKFPEGLGLITSLQCLDIRLCSLRYFPVGIKELTSLRMLTTFPVGKETGAKLAELGDLNLLEGELEIIRLGNVGGKSEAESANLKCKRNISVLMLSWKGIAFNPYEQVLENENENENEQVLEGLEPNPSLKKLVMDRYYGKTISPSWMVKLTNLVQIEFWFCRSCKHIPALGRLPSLRVISLIGLESLKRFHVHSNMFPSLQELNIDRCYKLVSLPRNLPKLKVLSLEYCPELKPPSLATEIFTNMKSLTIVACEHLRDIESLHEPEISRIPDLNIRAKSRSN